MAKNKHLTEEERGIIVDRLKEKESFKSISNALGKDCTTIAKEVKNHITISQVGCQLFHHIFIFPALAFGSRIHFFRRFSQGIK